jgi:glycerol uptake facilitator-like aquaporin
MEEGLPSYQLMSRKQYFRVNFAKFVIELYGTFILTIFYLMMGDQEAGMFLGIWVIIIFGMPISGSHFNPMITFG